MDPFQQSPNQMSGFSGGYDQRDPLRPQPQNPPFLPHGQMGQEDQMQPLISGMQEMEIKPQDPRKPKNDSQISGGSYNAPPGLESK